MMNPPFRVAPLRNSFVMRFPSRFRKMGTQWISGLEKINQDCVISQTPSDYEKWGIFGYRQTLFIFLVFDL